MFPSSGSSTSEEIRARSTEEGSEGTSRTVSPERVAASEGGDGVVFPKVFYATRILDFAYSHYSRNRSQPSCHQWMEAGTVDERNERAKMQDLSDLGDDRTESRKRKNISRPGCSRSDGSGYILRGCVVPDNENCEGRCSPRGNHEEDERPRTSHSQREDSTAADLYRVSACIRSLGDDVPDEFYSCRSLSLAGELERVGEDVEWGDSDDADSFVSADDGEGEGDDAELFFSADDGEDIKLDDHKEDADSFVSAHDGEEVEDIEQEGPFEPLSESSSGGTSEHSSKTTEERNNSENNGDDEASNCENMVDESNRIYNRLENGINKDVTRGRSSREVVGSTNGTATVTVETSKTTKVYFPSLTQHGSEACSCKSTVTKPEPEAKSVPSKQQSQFSFTSLKTRTRKLFGKRKGKELMATPKMNSRGETEEEEHARKSRERAEKFDDEESENEKREIAKRLRKEEKLGEKRYEKMCSFRCSGWKREVNSLVIGNLQKLNGIMKGEEKKEQNHLGVAKITCGNKMCWEGDRCAGGVGRVVSREVETATQRERRLRRLERESTGSWKLR